tara:strand:+ start:44 stop:187 length:144 start_codon:yes stop_codon:yes gene_type:complete
LTTISNLKIGLKSVKKNTQLELGEKLIELMPLILIPKEENVENVNEE